MTAFHNVVTFNRVLRKWLDAMESSDFPAARFYADQVKAIALLIAVDPAFRDIFVNYAGDCDSDDPEKATRSIGAFLCAVTEAALNGGTRDRE